MTIIQFEAKDSRKGTKYVLEENQTIVPSVAKIKTISYWFPWGELEVVEMNEEPKYALLKVSLKGFLDEIP